jgi:hypothetical protein
MGESEDGTPKKASGPTIRFSAGSTSLATVNAKDASS